jgi:hypothetical protein
MREQKEEVTSLLPTKPAKNEKPPASEQTKPAIPGRSLPEEQALWDAACALLAANRSFTDKAQLRSHEAEVLPVPTQAHLKTECRQHDFAIFR